MEQKTTIHIVDDEPRILEAIAHLIKPIDAEVKTYADAEEFLRDFRDDGPGCLVLDVRMPGMSGLELQTRLAEDGYTLPVVIVTGHADVRMAVDAVKAGAVSFLEKPFRPQELFDEIQRAVRADAEAWRRLDEAQNVERKLAPLKAGEREVLALIAKGKTNEQIAEELHLSVRGVEARRAKAMKTLRVDTKAELLRLLRNHAKTPQPDRNAAGPQVG
ncbi:MAG: response regulator transcription factor [Pirellulales bacterium]|nr:response regulator transcription factor [Pirellulales bacterium]